MKTNLKQHVAYSKNPSLFMREQWFSFDAFEKSYHLLTPFDYQIDFIDNVHRNEETLVIKSRQMHISSMMALYIAWYTLFSWDKQIIIISNNLSTGKRILESISHIMNNYFLNADDELSKIKPSTITSNSTHLLLSNGCDIKILAPSTNAGRGQHIDLLFIDEAAFINCLHSIYLPLALASTKIIITSTPKDDSYFNELYLNKKTNKIILHWKNHPEYSKEGWYEDMCEILQDKDKIEQELDCIVNFKPEVPKSKVINFRIEDDVYNKIPSYKKENMSEYIRELIRKDIGG